MKTASYEFLRAFDGIRIRSGFWNTSHTPCRGTVVVLGGRSECLEKYDESIGDLLERGYDVFSMDWRGQGLSGRMLGDATKGYVDDYEDYVRDLEHYLDIISSRNCQRPLMVLAHSMGASIVLHTLKRCPEAIDMGVLISPMVDVRTKPIPYSFSRWCSRGMVRLGAGHTAIPSLQRNDTYGRSFRGNWLTGDPVRFERIQTILKNDARLEVTSVTFGWLAATFDALDCFRRPEFFNSISTPLLLVAAGRDRVVSNPAIHTAASRLPNGEVMILAGARHEILQERDELRDQFWRAFDRFVER